MSSGKHRRSARILELDARRSQQAEGQNKGKEISEVEIKDAVIEEDQFSLKRGRKRAKIRPVQNLVVNKVEDQVEKVGNSSNEDHHTNAAVMSSGTALPERSKLDMLLGILQRRDSRKIFAEPVDSEEVKGYYDIIEEPMDFGTISVKLNGGSYKTLDELEHDVFLVSSNAMFFNHSNTIYYRQARAIRDLAKKLFDALKTDPENFGSELSMARLRTGYRDERRSIYSEEDRRGTYRALGSFLNENESIVSSVFNSSKPLVKIVQNNIGYKESLLRFVKDLGPTAQFIAWQKLKRCSTEVYNHQTGTPLRKLQTQEYQIPNVASLRKNNTAASSSNFLKNSTAKNFSRKVNILGNTLYAGKASKFYPTNMNDVLSSRSGQPTNTMKNPVDCGGKSAQTLRDRTAILKQDMAVQSIGKLNFPTSSLGDGNPYLSTTWNTNRNHDKYSSSTINKGKNFQMADASSSYTTRNPVAPHRKSIQAIREEATAFNENVADQGSGSSYFSTALLGDRKSYLSATPNTYNDPDKFISGANNKGKNVQIAEVSSSYSMEHPGGNCGKSEHGMRQKGAVSNADMADQGSGSSYFSTALLSDRKSYLSATPNTYNDPDKFISGANNKGKNVQIAEVSSSYSMEHPGGNCGKSEHGMRQKGAVSNADMADQGSGSAYFSTDLFGAFSATQSTHSNPDKSITCALNKGKSVLIAEVNSLAPMDPDDYHRKHVLGMREVGSFKVDMSDQSIGSSFFNTPLPVDENSYLPAIRHTHDNTGGFIARAIDKSQNDQMAEMTSSDPRMLESLFASDNGDASSKSQQWLPPAMGSSWSQAQSTRGLDSNYLGGGVQEVQARAGRGGTNNESRVAQAGQTWNWFKPTQLVPQPILSSSFQEQSGPTKVDLAGQAGSSKWGGWDTQSPNQQVLKGSFMNESHQTNIQRGDLSIGAPLGNNYLQQSPLGTKYHQQFPLEDKFHQQSRLGSNYQQQSSLVTNNQQQSPLANKYWQQSPLGNDHQQQFPLGNDYQQQFPLANDYRQHSSLANNYRRQSSLCNNHQQKSSFANDNGPQSFLVANNYQQQSLLASNYERQYSLGNNYQQKSSLANNYQQQSPMINNHRRQSPLGNSYQQQSPLASNYQQQSHLATNYKQQSCVGNDYRQQSPVDANMLHQRFRL